VNHSQSSRPWLGGILALVALAGAAWLLRPRPVARDAVTVAAAPAPAEVARSAPVAAEPQRSPVLVEPAASSVPSAPPAPIGAPPAPNAELTVAGRVLDELDVPLAEFTVRAERVGRPAPGSRSPVSARFRDAGGRFELRGLAPGEWELSARANGHAPSPPRIVALPADGPIELSTSAADSGPRRSAATCSSTLPRLRSSCTTSMCRSRGSWAA